MERIETVGQAAKFCVPTALSLLTGFTREAVVIGLAKKTGARNINGGYMRNEYMSWLYSLPKSVVEIGLVRNGPRNAADLPAGTWLVSGQIRGSDRGHCFIVWNGLLFDNNFIAVPLEQLGDNYLCWYYYPVINSQLNKSILKMANHYNQKVAA